MGSFVTRSRSLRASFWVNFHLRENKAAMKVFGCVVTLLVFSILPSEIKSQGAEVTNIVEFDMTIGGQPAGTIVIGLYGKTTPRTANNFYQLAQSKVPEGYIGAPFHRVIPNFMIQGGDFTRQDGTGGFSIYGEKFDDENFILKHTKRGLLSMANAGPDTNGSQFFITVVETPWLDGKHTVFGEVIRGMDVVDRIVNTQKDSRDRPLSPVVISAARVN